MFSHCSFVFGLAYLEWLQIYGLCKITAAQYFQTVDQTWAARSQQFLFRYVLITLYVGKCVE